MQLTDETLEKITALQRNEITEHYIYMKIAGVTADPHNQEVLFRIAAEELTHYTIWKQYTAKEIGPSMLRIWFYYLIARLLGMTFAIKLMEGVEQGAQTGDETLLASVPEMPAMLANEAKHERELIALIDEERLKYVGSRRARPQRCTRRVHRYPCRPDLCHPELTDHRSGRPDHRCCRIALDGSLRVSLAAVRGDHRHEPEKGRILYRA